MREEQREGWQIKAKHVHRLYCLKGLQVRMRRRRKKPLAHTEGCQRLQAELMSTGVWSHRDSLWSLCP